MDETDKNLRISTFDTLTFFASRKKQDEFASKVHHDDYLSEMSCWWFDSFMPESPFIEQRFSQSELQVLRPFSQQVEQIMDRVPKPRPIGRLLFEVAPWAEFVAQASAASQRLAASASNPSFQRTTTAAELIR